MTNRTARKKALIPSSDQRKRNFRTLSSRTDLSSCFREPVQVRPRFLIPKTLEVDTLDARTHATQADNEETQPGFLHLLSEIRFIPFTINETRSKRHNSRWFLRKEENSLPKPKLPNFETPELQSVAEQESRNPKEMSVQIADDRAQTSRLASNIGSQGTAVPLAEKRCQASGD